MKVKTSKLDKRLHDEIEAAYYRLAQNVEVRVMDILKIFRDAKIEHSAGVAVAASMPAIIERYRVKA